MSKKKTVLMDDLAERIAHRKGYTVKDSKEFLETLEDVMIEALREEEEVKFGMFFKLHMKYYQEKERGWDGVNQRYVKQPAKLLPKLHPLSKMKALKKEVTDSRKKK